MTFLFTDIVGSTRQWEESPHMDERVERHFRVLRERVEAARGEVFSTMGDGIAAAFTSVESAVEAAIAVQREMPSIGLAVRMGIHTGEVERIGGDFRGRPVNRAARIMAIGHGGQILVSDVSAAIVRSGSRQLQLDDLGTHRLRDLSEPERLWQVVHGDLASDFPPLRGVDMFPHNLPAPRSTLVGRDPDIQRVVRLTRSHRVVTLTGVGGVGKTRLAIHAAADLLTEFASVVFVDLARVSDPADVPDAIARTVGAVAPTEALSTAGAMSRGARRLLVLDNCEHVVDSSASAVDVLTAACPELVVLATSREVLGVDGEHVFRVRSLDPATTAAELFRQRAVAAGMDLAQLDPGEIRALCGRLDGIPLAIELAAARTPSLGIAVIAGALDHVAGLSSRRRAGGDDRQGTMRATIEWSYRLLDADEQRLFRWMAVFPGGFEHDAVLHVAATLGIPERAATEHIASLVHKSMVTSDMHVDGLRYRMLELMRGFAIERVNEKDERDAAWRAMVGWITTITDLPYDDPCNARVERNAIRLEREADNWREAVVEVTRRRSAELAQALCGPPVAFFLLGRHDLADVVQPLLGLCHTVSQRRAVLTALIVSASGGTHAAQLQRWAEEVQRIDEIAPTGLGGLMRWMALAWRGEFVTSVEVCVAASLDLRLRQSTRDMFVGIAVLDHFSLTDTTSDTHDLIPRAIEVADRSDVALHRATCLLGAAWGVASSDPDRALRLVRRALNEVPHVPALTRLTLPGSAARLLTRLDPKIAAQGLLDQLDATPARSSFVDLIPLFYAATLLVGLGSTSAEQALITVTAAPVAPHQSMMDFVDLARRAAVAADEASIGHLEATVRAALTEVVYRGRTRRPATELVGREHERPQVDRPEAGRQTGLEQQLREERVGRPKMLPDHGEEDRLPRPGDDQQPVGTGPQRVDQSGTIGGRHFGER